MSSSDDETENANIPDVNTCQKLCEEFASVTDTDTACAQFFLQDRDWNLERSVNAFFENKHSGSTMRCLGDDDSEPEVVLVMDGSEKSLSAAATAIVMETATARASTSTSPASDVLTFITWNIDGLDEKNLKLRTRAACKIIKSESADIVFLQEVVPESAEILLCKLPEYRCLFGNEYGYFTATLLKKSTVQFQEKQIEEFGESRMARNLMKIRATFGRSKLLLLNSHLESTVDGARERRQQLKTSFQRVLEVSDDCSVIFAGDLNLRNKEVDEVGGIPSGIEDVWVSCGSRKECAYTFDMMRNDNLLWNQRFKPRARYDRVYFKPSTPATLKAKHFGLLGLERLLPHRCFPSDHWGILCHYQLVPLK